MIRISLSHLKVMYPVKRKSLLHWRTHLSYTHNWKPQILHFTDWTSLSVLREHPLPSIPGTIQGNKELKWIVLTWDQKIITERKKWQMSSDTVTCFVKSVNCVFCSHPLSKSYICFMNRIFFLPLWTLWSVFLSSPTCILQNKTRIGVEWQNI